MTTRTAHTNRDKLFLDIFTTALEGGIGYWSTCSAYHWSNSEVSGEMIDAADYSGFYAEIEDAEDDDKAYRIDRSVVAKGYKLATTTERHKIGWSAGGFPLVVTDESRNDLDFDAGDADCVVQLGLFGKVVYG